MALDPHGPKASADGSLLGSRWHLGRSPVCMFSPGGISNFKSSRLGNHFKNLHCPRKKNTYHIHTNEQASFTFSFMGRGCEHKQDIQIKIDCFILIDLWFPAHYLPRSRSGPFHPSLCSVIHQGLRLSSCNCFVTSWNVKAKMEILRITLPIPSWL